MVELNFKKMQGLVPAIIQDYKSGNVLMLGFMNKAAWKKTLQTGKVYFYSRTRKKLWMKGETSGNIQIIKERYIDCDDDTVLLKVDQVGGVTCHKGNASCFSRRIVNGKLEEHPAQGF